MARKHWWWYFHPESDCVFNSDVKPSVMLSGGDGLVEELCEQKVFPKDINEAYRYLVNIGNIDYVNKLKGGAL